MIGKGERMPSEPTPELSDEEFEKIANAGIEEALSHIRKDYEGNADPIDDLDYHYSGHTEGVVERIEKILRALEASEQEVQFGRLLAGFHDVTQRTEPSEEGPDGKIIRTREEGKSEADSFEELVKYMRKVNKETERKVFTSHHISLAREAFKVTIPAFVDGAVIQKYLDNDTTKIARALALADLGAAGMDPEDHISAGRSLFMEMNIDIKEALKDYPQTPIDEAKKEFYRKRMLDWLEGQVDFPNDREKRFPQETSAFTEEEQDKLKKDVFNKFGTSAFAAAHDYEYASKLTFEELFGHFGYNKTK